MILRCTDAHCHTDFAALKIRADELDGLSVCFDACFGGDWNRLLELDFALAKKAYGLHPDLRLSEFDDAELAEDVALNLQLPSLEKYLLNASAIGETGLDNAIAERVPISLQRKIFLAQLALAEKYSLPPIIHCVDAWGEVFDILQVWSKTKFKDLSTKRFMLHAAKCSPEMAERFCAIGGYLSFGVRELNTKKGSQSASIVPSNRLFVESDAFPDRTILEACITQIARLRKIDAMDLSERIFENFTEFFI